MIRQGLSQKMLQKLSPQQIQLMKLLQVPADQLEQRIKEELETNPALEEGLPESSENTDFDQDDSDYNDNNEDRFELDDYMNEYIEDDPTTYKTKNHLHSQDEDQKTIPIPVETSFHDYLEQQLGLLTALDERQSTIADQIIGSIDEDGYLRRDIPSITDDLMFAHNLIAEESEIEGILKLIQQFDPAGVGARDLQECLLLQMEHAINSQSDSKALLLAKTILTDHFDAFTKKHYDKLIKTLEISENDLKNSLDEILRLNPKPASAFVGNSSKNSIQYVIPDFYISNRDGLLELSLHSKNAPDLYINDHYKDLLKSAKKNNGLSHKKDKETLVFIKQKIDSAKWFIDAIKQRQDTLYRTMYAILQYQYEYFSTGDAKKLKPMILKDISDLTGLDISTISRVVNSKFVQSEFGTKKLKEFFSESMQTDSGEEVSTLEVKKILNDLVAVEDKRKPLSDEKLKELLTDKGYNIARRTVAKYREQLNIPVARLRKAL
jgi:RNA polymerase sigma-54 factor